MKHLVLVNESNDWSLILKLNASMWTLGFLLRAVFFVKSLNFHLSLCHKRCLFSYFSCLARCCYNLKTILCFFRNEEPYSNILPHLLAFSYNVLPRIVDFMSSFQFPAVVIWLNVAGQYCLLAILNPTQTVSIVCGGFMSVKGLGFRYRYIYT